MGVAHRTVAVLSGASHMILSVRGKLARAARGHVRSSPIALIMLVIAGCGETGSQAQMAHDKAVVGSRELVSGRKVMLLGVIDEHKIRNTSEARVAEEHAIRTELAMVPLLKELGRPGLSERERADKEREIDTLRKQYNREMEPVDAFHRELGRKIEKAERTYALKDPEIERIREEMRLTLERRGKNERKEIKRLQGEYERRRRELERK